jgi:Ca2+-binding RTX toxin-like protein
MDPLNQQAVVAITGLQGSIFNGTPTAVTYRNDSGTFNNISANLTGVRKRSASWADYDRDGDLDLFVSGRDSSIATISKLYRNDSGVFNEVSAAITGARYSSSSWADYDNDGDLDLLLAGRDNSNSNFTKLYRNEGSDTFAESSVSLPGVAFGSVAWGDYDSDGDQDLLVSGSISAGRVSAIYRNDGNEIFTDISAGLLQLNNSSAAWGDYDNDGDLDLLLIGQESSGAQQSRIYRNGGNNTFTDISAGLPGLFYGAVAWGDLDNDGDLDAILTGRASGSIRTTKVFVNNAGTFSDDGSAYIGFDLNSVAPGDYDNDGDLDLMIAGRSASDNLQVNVYRNNISTVNTAPAAPVNLTASESSPTSLTFSWSAPADSQTASAGLSYNLRVGTTPGGSNVYASMANASNGRRRIPALGPIQGTSFTLKGLTAGQTYYWSVQAIDPSFAGSAFATETNAAINAAPTAVSASPNPASIAENSSTGSRVKVADLSVTDDGRGTNSLSLTGTDQASFEVIGTELFLKAGVTLNYEAKTNYAVTVNVDDASTGGNPDASTSFSLNITDVNEAPTALSLQNATTSLPEDTSTASAVKLADVVVTDDALGTNVLSLSGTDAALFEIVSNELRLKANTVLDFEAKSIYNVTVEVNDAAVGGAVDASQAFALTLTDVNEAPTAVTLQNTTTSLAENTSTATAIKLADISVTDDALGTNVLSLSGTDAAFFEIVSNELRLKAGTVLDFEAKSIYNVTVEVNDAAVGGAVDASQAFALTLTDVNEAPTAVTLQNTTTSLAENTSTATAIKLADISVTDDALGTNVLSLSGTDAAFFEIVSNELRLKAGTVLDFEAKSTYNVTVEVNDGAVGGAVDASQAFALTLTDVNEAPTAVTLQNTTTSLAENTSTATAIKLADISVTDDALGTNVLSLSGTDAAFFEIVSNELRLKAGTVLDFEAKSIYNVTVEVNDAAVGGAVDAFVPFTLSLTNVLDTTTSPDAFRIVFSAVDVTITHAINGGTPVTLGPFPLSSPILLNGLEANDSVRVLGTAGPDLFTVSSSGLVVNGTTVTLTGPASRTLVGAAGNDVYQFDADSVLGVWSLDESGGGLDTVDFSLTSTVNVVFNMATAGIQAVHATNLSLVLGSAVTIENVIGGTGDDTLFGNSLNNTVTGGAGNDRLIGAGGDDLLIGGADNDIYVFVPTSAAEADQVTENPNEGIDTLSFAFLTTDVSVDLGLTSIQMVHLNRTVTLSSAVAIENILGGTGADTLNGNSLSNTLSGGAGDDRLNGGAGNDFLFGGANNDTYVFVPSVGPEVDQVTENLNDGTDTLNFSSLTTDVLLNLGSSFVQSVHTDRTLKLNSAGVFENIIGGTGADTLFGNSLNNTISGGAGNDKLIGAGGDDLLMGGADNDTYVFAAASAAEADQVTENPNEGIDTLSFAFMTTDVSVSLGLTSVQTVHLNRTVTLNSAVVIENILGGTGGDTLTGNSLSNTLSGGAGDDRLNGGAGNDFLFGGANNDTYIFAPSSGTEADQLTERTGEGNDTLSFVDLTTDILLNLGSSFVQSVHTDRTLKLNSAAVFENIIGGTGADTLFGNSLNNTISGGAGNDKLIGAGGDDLLIGGANNDTYLFVPSAGPEADEVVENTNEGIDTLLFAYLSTDVTLNLGSTSLQTVHTDRTLKLNSVSTFENAVGGTGNDTLLGNALANRLTGGEGNNILVGLEAGDILEAGSGRDILIGGLGLDILIGGAGDDILIAGLTTSDTSLTNLSTLRTAWISPDAYETRVASLRAGAGSPEVSLKSTINVLNDAGDDDNLVGGTETDWFFRALDDVIADLLTGEVFDVL